MSDIMTRMSLSTDEFERGLSKAKASVGSFENGVNGMASKVASGFMKAAGAVGLVVTATEGFNKIMQSSQTLGDEYTRVMDGLKGGVDQFFYSIGSGDWTPFMDGLSDAIRLASEASDALDRLGNARMSFDYFNSENQATVQKQITILRDKDSTEEQKQAARKLLDETLKDQEDIVGQYKLKSDNAIKAMLRAAIGMDGVDVSAMDARKFLRLDISAMGDDQKKELSNQYKEFKDKFDSLKDKYRTYETVGSGMNVHVVSSIDTNALNKELGPVLSKYQDAIKYNAILVKKNDDWLKKVIEIHAASESAKNSLESMTKAANRASQSGAEGTKTPKAEAPRGSFGYLDKQISDKKRELQVAVSDDSRLKIQKELDSLVREKRIMEVQVAYKMNEGKESLDDMLKQSGKNIKKIINETDEATSKMVKDIKLPQINKTDIKNNTEYADSLSGISTIMGSIAQMTNDSGAAWLTWSANLMTAIGTAIPLIDALIGKKQTEAIVNGVNSASETPVVGWILAGAAMAAMIALFASMPKFADGGTIGGSSYFGDNILARVNSGEMILNQGQQSNLFEAINSGRMGGGGDLHSSVTTRMRGKDMILIINNELKSQGKKPIS